MMFGMWVFGQNSAYRMLVGTYTNGKSDGIYALSFDKKGKLVSQNLAATTDNPSFLAFSPDKKFVYAVNESGENSAVSAFRFEEKENKLTFLNKIPLGNAGPCFVNVTEKHVITANYGNGTISVLERKNDGFLTDTVKTITHQRKMFGRGKFGPSNVHQVLFSPDGKYMIATNLGTDCIYSYAYNPNSVNEIFTQIDVKILKKHSGPRHTAFSKDGKYLYLLQELNADLTVFEFSSEGKLDAIQTSSVINNSKLANGAADIHLSPDGKFLYATNRGEANDITCFKVEKNGKITKKSSYSTGGNAPRNFAISPDGKFLFIGNQKTDNITIFSRKQCNGKLKKLNQDVSIGAPVCLLFY